MSFLEEFARVVSFAREIDKRTGIVHGARDIATLYASSGGDVEKAMDEMRRRLHAAGDEARRKLESKKPPEE